MSVRLVKLAPIGRKINLDGETIQASNPSEASAKAGVRVNTDGTVEANIDDVYSQIDAATDWIIPNRSARSSYEIRATLNSGSLDTGNTGVWEDLSVNREWTVEVGSAESQSANITLEIRDGTTILTSGVYDLSAATV